MGTRLISLFGTGDYEDVRYRLGSITTDQPTALLPQALVELYDKGAGSAPVTSMAIIGTEDARRNYDSRYPLAGRQLERRFRGAFAFDRVDAGSEREQQRQVFQTLVRWLQPEPVQNAELKFAEAEPPGEIVLDITHGLRPQALIAGAAVPFVFAEAVRQGTRDLPLIRVLYGRHERGDGQGDPDYVAEVWDLTDFVSTTLWTIAIQAVRYGRADAAELLGTQESRRQIDQALAAGVTGADLAPSTYPGRLGQALRDFADSLAFLRVPEVIREKGKASRVHAILQRPERHELIQRIPVLKALLDDLERDVMAVTSASGKVLDEAGLQAMVNLAELYGRFERFAEQAATLREAYVTHFGLHHVTPSPQEKPFPEPGEKGAHREREAVEASIPSLDPSRQRPARPDAPRAYTGTAPEELLILLNQARGLRNDFLHLAIRDEKGADAARLRKRFADLQQELARMLDAPPP
jgi:CRISPR-associated DxTHG motif protein